MARDDEEIKALWQIAGKIVQTDTIRLDTMDQEYCLFCSNIVPYTPDNFNFKHDDDCIAIKAQTLIEQKRLSLLEQVNRQIATLAHIKKIAEDEVAKLYKKCQKDRYKYWRIKESHVTPCATVYQSYTKADINFVQDYYGEDYIKETWHDWAITVITETDPLPDIWMNEIPYHVAFKPEEGWVVCEYPDMA